MADTEVFQAAVLTAGDQGPAVSILAAQGAMLAALNYPSEFAQAAQASIVTAARGTVTADVPQASVMFAGRGRIDNRRLRAWGFPLDGHDIYVLRLGEDMTLIYDLTTGQWAEWSGHDLPYWRAHLGQAWIGMGAALFAEGHSTNVVAGDDNWGLLWTLAPEDGADQSPRADLPEVPFGRVAMGGAPMQMRERVQCNAVYLTLSLGNPPLVGTTVTLRTSDDLGKTWTDHGAIAVEAGNYEQEFGWRSLGLIKHPGRIFSIEDNGVQRIGGADMR